MRRRSGRSGRSCQQELPCGRVAIDRPADYVPRGGQTLPLVHQHGLLACDDTLGIGAYDLKLPRIVEAIDRGCPPKRGFGLPHRPRTFERDCRKTADQLIQLAIDDSGQIAPHRRKSYYLDAFNTTDRTVPTLPIGRVIACNTVMAVDRKVGYGMAMADTRASANSRVLI